MGNKSKNKDYLVQGTILVAASFIARIIGMVYRIPLKNILGTEGIGYYSTANELYNIILMVSFSIPLAVQDGFGTAPCRRTEELHTEVFSVPCFAIAVGSSHVHCDILIRRRHYKICHESRKCFLCSACPGTGNFPFCHNWCVPVDFPGTQHHGSHGGFTRSLSRSSNAIVSLAATLSSCGVMEQSSVKKRAMTTWACLWCCERNAWNSDQHRCRTNLSFSLSIWPTVADEPSRCGGMLQIGKEADREIYKILIWTLVPIVLSTVIYNIPEPCWIGVFNARFWQITRAIPRNSM